MARKVNNVEKKEVKKNTPSRTLKKNKVKIVLILVVFSCLCVYAGYSLCWDLNHVDQIKHKDNYCKDNCKCISEEVVAK